MSYEPDKHHRRTIRLEGYDYSQSRAYFITMITHKRVPFFEKTTIRRIVENCWLAIPSHFATVSLDEWIIMPDHFHGIIIITGDVHLDAPAEDARDQNNRFSTISPKRNTLSVIVRTCKSAVTTQCRRMGQVEFKWQRNYYERIIRDEYHMPCTRQYIINNQSNEPV